MDDYALTDGIVTNVGGDLMALVVNLLKGQPFKSMSQADQTETLDRIRRHVADGVRTAVNEIAAAGRVTVAATLDKVVFGAGGVQAIMTISGVDPQRLSLADSRGKTCLIVVSNPSEHMGGLDDQQAEPDQRRIA